MKTNDLNAGADVESRAPDEAAAARILGQFGGEHAGGQAYHVVSRTAGGEMLFGEVEKEAFRRLMWRMAKFSGVEILT